MIICYQLVFRVRKSSIPIGHWSFLELFLLEAPKGLTSLVMVTKEFMSEVGVSGGGGRILSGWIVACIREESVAFRSLSIYDHGEANSFNFFRVGQNSFRAFPLADQAEIRIYVWSN